MKRRITGVALALGLLALAGAAGVLVQLARPPALDGDELARFRARQANTERALDATWSRPPSREPPIDGDAGEIVRAGLPAELPDRRPIVAAWGAIDDGTALPTEIEDWIHAHGTALALAAQQGSRASRATWPRADAEQAETAAQLLFLRGAIARAEAAEECLGSTIDALQLVIDAHRQVGYALVPLTRCLPHAAPEARREAARRMAHLVANERPFGVWVEDRANFYMGVAVTEPQLGIGWRYPAMAYAEQRRRARELGNVRTTLAHDPRTLRALSGGCLPECLRALQGDRDTTEPERQALMDTVVGDAIFATTELRLMAALVAISAGERDAAAGFRDPIDGAPLRTTTNDGELIVYSIGRDSIDAHGRDDDVRVIVPAEVQ